MTKKVKVTHKQADWLRKYRGAEEIDYAVDVQAYKNLRPDSPIADWMPSKVARAFYVGYEVEMDVNNDG